jgi:hypothetical protein
MLAVHLPGFDLTKDALNASPNAPATNQHPQERNAKAHTTAAAPPDQPHASLRVHDLDEGALRSVEQLLSAAADKRRAKAAAAASAYGGAGGVSGSSRATGGSRAASAAGSVAARLYASAAGRAGGGRS